MDPQVRSDKDAIYSKYCGWAASLGKKPYKRDWFFRTLNSLADINTEDRWDPETEKTRTKDGNKAKRWVKGLKIKP